MTSIVEHSFACGVTEQNSETEVVETLVQIHLAKVKRRTTAYDPPQLGATQGDDLGPLHPCSVTSLLSKIKWRTVQVEQVQRVGSSVSSQERGRVDSLKETKALTVGVEEAHAHEPNKSACATSGMGVKQGTAAGGAGGLGGGGGYPLESDARGQEARVGAPSRGHLVAHNRGEEVCPEIWHTRALRNLEVLTRGASGNHT